MMYACSRSPSFSMPKSFGCTLDTSGTRSLQAFMAEAISLSAFVPMRARDSSEIGSL